MCCAIPGFSALSLAAKLGSKGEKRKHELTSHIPNLSSNAHMDHYPLLLYLVGQSCLTLCNPMDCSRQVSLSFTISRSLLKLMSIESVMPSNHLISVTPFSFFPQSFSASGSFPMSRSFESGGQSIRASASVLPMNIQDSCPLGLTSIPMKTQIQPWKIQSGPPLGFANCCG